MMARIIELAFQMIGGRKKFRVTFNRGRQEAMGFAYKWEADSWAKQNCHRNDWIVDEPDAIDLRILPKQKRPDQMVDGRRVRWVG